MLSPRKTLLRDTARGDPETRDPVRVTFSWGIEAGRLDACATHELDTGYAYQRA